jgi:hypothetical protein
MRDIDALIRERAYLIWENSGKPSGREADHWFQAAREIEEAMAKDPFAVTAVETMPAPPTVPDAPPMPEPQANGQGSGEAGPAPSVKAAAATKRMPLKMPQSKKK